MKNFPQVFAVFFSIAFASFGFGEPQPESVSASSGVQPSRLPDLEARSKAEPGYRSRVSLAWDVCDYVGSNELKSADDYLRVVSLLGPTLGLSFEIERTQYESVLTALAKGGLDRRSMLVLTWNGLQRSLGRPYRFHFASQSLPDPEPEEPMPACISKVWSNPIGASAAAAQTKDNAEMQSLRDSDQDARKRSGTLLNDQTEGMKLFVADLARANRTRQIVEEGALATARDFSNAALVLQHSSRFDGYRLAHELAVASMILGDRKTGTWLVAATYDRMLRSVGHKQRFGTQSSPDRGMLPVDEYGICDEMRVALAGKTLAQQRERSPKRQPPSPASKQEEALSAASAK